MPTSLSIAGTAMAAVLARAVAVDQAPLELRGAVVTLDPLPRAVRRSIVEQLPHLDRSRRVIRQRVYRLVQEMAIAVAAAFRLAGDHAGPRAVGSAVKEHVVAGQLLEPHVRGG